MMKTTKETQTATKAENKKTGSTLLSAINTEFKAKRESRSRNGLLKKYNDYRDWVGKYVSSKTINYITKNMLKVDERHKEYQGKVLCSKGIGTNYAKSINAKNNKFKGSKTNETYKLPNGAKLNLPIYYRNAIYTEEEGALS